MSCGKFHDGNFFVMMCLFNLPFGVKQQSLIGKKFETFSSIFGGQGEQILSP
jgi:hypothetical protein